MSTVADGSASSSVSESSVIMIAVSPRGCMSMSAQDLYRIHARISQHSVLANLPCHRLRCFSSILPHCEQTLHSRLTMRPEPAQLLQGRPHQEMIKRCGFFF